MKIVVSPAKSLDLETEYPPKINFTQPVFLEQAVKLNKVLAKKSLKH